MPPLRDSYPEVRDALIRRYGLAGVSDDAAEPFEALVATALGQALTGPKLVAAISTLRDDGLLDPQALAEADPAEVEEALRGAGLRVSRSALLPLQRLARWLVELHHGAADDLAGPGTAVPVDQLREELR